MESEPYLQGSSYAVTLSGVTPASKRSDCRGRLVKPHPVRRPRVSPWIAAGIWCHRQLASLDENVAVGGCCGGGDGRGRRRAVAGPPPLPPMEAAAARGIPWSQMSWEGSSPALWRSGRPDPDHRRFVGGAPGREGSRWWGVFSAHAQFGAASSLERNQLKPSLGPTPRADGDGWMSRAIQASGVVD